VQGICPGFQGLEAGTASTSNPWNCSAGHGPHLRASRVGGMYQRAAVVAGDYPPRTARASRRRLSRPVLKDPAPSTRNRGRRCPYVRQPPRQRSRWSRCHGGCCHARSLSAYRLRARLDAGLGKDGAGPRRLNAACWAAGGSWAVLDARPLSRSKCARTLVMLFAGKPKSTPRNPSHLLLPDPAAHPCRVAPVGAPWCRAKLDLCKSSPDPLTLFCQHTQPRPDRQAGPSVVWLPLRGATSSRRRRAAL